jgi:L-iditol 2-dehydrogenase
LRRKLQQESGTMADQSRLNNEYPVPERMKAWVLGGPGEIVPVEKPVPQPGAAEVLVRIDAVAICATDLEIMRHGLPANG